MRKRLLMALFCAAMMLPAAAQWTPGDYSQTKFDNDTNHLFYYEPTIIRKADGSSLVGYKSRGYHINPDTGEKEQTSFYYLHFQKLDKDGNKQFPEPGIVISHQLTQDASFSYLHMDTMSNGNVVFSFADERSKQGENFPGAGLEAYAYCYTQDGEPVWSPDGVKLPTYMHDSVVLGRRYGIEDIAVSGEHLYFGAQIMEQVNEWHDTAWFGVYYYYFEMVCMDYNGNILSQRVDSVYPAFNFEFIPAPDDNVYFLYVRSDDGYNAERIGTDCQNIWPDTVQVENLGVTRHEGALQQSYMPYEYIPMSDGSIGMVYPAMLDNMRASLTYNRLYPDGSVLGHVFMSDTLGISKSHTCILEGDTLTVFNTQDISLNSGMDELYMNLNSIKLDGTKLHPETSYGYWLRMDRNVKPQLIGAMKANGNYHALIQHQDIYYLTNQSYCYTFTLDGEKVGRKPILGDFLINDRTFYSDGNLAKFLFTQDEGGAGGLWQACIDVTDDTNTKPETGELNGKFTINADGKQIVFSQANLQYWNHISAIRFGSKQWDEQDGKNQWMRKPTVVFWYDLFGWGTGDDWRKTSTDSTNYATYTDWGLNDIMNTSYDPGTWRAMSADEWDYLLTKRENADTKWSLGTAHLGINTEVRGLILLPDEFEFPDTLKVIPNVHNFSTNKYIPVEWARLEANGAVFIPMGSYRLDTVVLSYDDMHTTPLEGRYWTSTPDGDCYAKALVINQNGWESQSMPRSYGLSVRLVKDVDSEQGIEDVLFDDKQNRTRKILMDGVIYILRDGKIFTTTGVQVK